MKDGRLELKPIGALALVYEAAALRFRSKAFELMFLTLKANFNANQPRVPAGNQDGGQWTADSSSQRYTATASTVSADVDRARTSSTGKPALVMSDANPDPIIAGQQYAATIIDRRPNSWTGISKIDDTTTKLSVTLASVVDSLPQGFGARYGTQVHSVFASAVRALKISGIRPSDVETTFTLHGNARYGAPGSIRTDVVLRNDADEIMAIYDVKTGSAGLTEGRVNEIRRKTKTDWRVPIIEMSVPRGVSVKANILRSPLELLCHRVYVCRR